MRKPILLVVMVCCVVLVTARTSMGSGFEVAELAGRLLGNAYAGKAAIAEDASTVFFNPAGMTMLKELQVAITSHMLKTGGKWHDDGSTGATGGKLSGKGDDPGGWSYIPTFYAVAPLAEDIRLGFGVFGPFGLVTDYDDDWQGRYFATESSLEVINVNLAGAYKYGDVFDLGDLSIGAGVNWQRADATLTNAIDFGSIGFAALGPATATALGLSPEGNDGQAVVNSSYSVNWGWNAGLLFELSEQTRFGLAYRSKVFHKLEGGARFQVPKAAKVLTGGGAFKDVDVVARITLPEQISLSGYHELDDQWAILADVTWTNWSRFDELRVVFDNPVQPDAASPARWNDTFRYALGAVYKANDKWTFRVGTAFDESPIVDEHRTPRIPTNDRIWLAVGVGYEVMENVVVDLSWMHVFIDDSKIDQTASTTQRLKGEFRGSADVIAIQFTVGL